ncbi:spermidine synthase [Rathayibacter sp. VKM Ac-2857]|uniref:spermidine synthase n=1 Tax=Rathayibacter sp. VKM Ac-2857 TaxID=2739020 RepID=UPI0015633361|nr:fused MFS/spermidine synthase [Rathayibacter sp. VKM Ac-2857]NQX15259.1 fused MFS/spermidine synthase [Rathayibacter sp. VKM Ac-2857]
MAERTGRRRGDDSEHPRAVLASGFLAQIEPDRHSADAATLVVDGTPQSHVDLSDPTHLSFEYVRRIGHAIDLLAPEGEAVTALHLGAGALTLPRYVAATRPGSRQQVVEIEAALVDLVREALPLPRGAQIRIRQGDAREVLGKLPPGLLGTVDVVVVDIFSGARTPAHVTSAEFYREIAPLLAPAGIVAVNVADGGALAFARAQAATLAAVFAHTAIMTDTQMLKAKRFGNVVMLASPSPLPVDGLPRRLASDPAPAKLVQGRELENFLGGASVVTDDTATPSPLPARSIFQVRRG